VPSYDDIAVLRKSRAYDQALAYANCMRRSVLVTAA
jgi:hypothetical protein